MSAEHVTVTTPLKTLLSALLFYRERNWDQSLDLNLRCQISVPVLFAFILYLYLYYQAVVEPYQESQEFNSPSSDGQAHEAGIYIAHDCDFQKEPTTRSHGALAALCFQVLKRTILKGSIRIFCRQCRDRGGNPEALKPLPANYSTSSTWKIVAHRDNEGANLQEKTRQFLDCWKPTGSPAKPGGCSFCPDGCGYLHVRSQEYWDNWESWENAHDFENHTQVTWVGLWCHAILYRKSSASNPSPDCSGRGQAGLHHCPL